jgi:predicted amidophosphoribosyltransferase
MQRVSALLESLLSVRGETGDGVCPLSEEEPPEEEELIVESPVLDILGDMYVCSNCGGRLTEIPTYNRFYCENCGLHY